MYSPSTSFLTAVLTFLKYICDSVHYQSILLSNQRDAALSSRIYYPLRDYMFRVFFAPIIRSTLKL